MKMEIDISHKILNSLGFFFKKKKFYQNTEYNAMTFFKNAVFIFSVSLNQVGVVLSANTLLCSSGCFIICLISSNFLQISCLKNLRY